VEGAYQFRLALERTLASRARQAPAWIEDIAKQVNSFDELLQAIGPALENQVAAGTESRSLVTGGMDQFRLDLEALYVKGRDLTDRIVALLTTAVQPPGGKQLSKVTDLLRALELSDARVGHLQPFFQRQRKTILWLGSTFSTFRNIGVHLKEKFQKCSCTDGCITLSVGDPHLLEQLQPEIVKRRGVLAHVLPGLVDVPPDPVATCLYVCQRLHELPRNLRGDAEDLVKRVAVISSPIEDIVEHLGVFAVAALDEIMREAPKAWASRSVGPEVS
jgi:hypothetical protein